MYLQEVWYILGEGNIKIMQNQKQLIPKNFEKEYMRYYNKEIKRSELCKKFTISSGTVRSWRIKCGLPKVKKQFHGEIPENFEEEYMRYYNEEINQSELRRKFRIGQSLMYKWRNKCNLPVARSKKGIPENFEEEYMKCYNEGRPLKKLHKKLKISESLMYRWRQERNLPHIYLRGTPENFEEEYMKYYNREMDHNELCHKLGITWNTLCQCRNKLNLPKVMIFSRKEIPENFEEEYMKYYRREISCKELRKRLNITEGTLLRWRDKFNLPCVEGRRQEQEIPENFEKEYMKYYNREINMNDLCKKFNIGSSTIYKWRNKCSLPCTIKSPNETTLKVPVFIDLSDEFPDEIEY